MADPDLPDDLQRWTAKRRAALVLSILKGDTTPQEAARKHGLTVAEVEAWRDNFLSGAENALRTRPHPALFLLAVPPPPVYPWRGNREQVPKP